MQLTLFHPATGDNMSTLERIIISAATIAALAVIVHVLLRLAAHVQQLAGAL